MFTIKRAIFVLPTYILCNIHIEISKTTQMISMGVFGDEKLIKLGIISGKTLFSEFLNKSRSPRYYLSMIDGNHAGILKNFKLHYNFV